LRGDVIRAVVEAGGVVRQRQVEIGDIDVHSSQSTIATRSAVMRMLPGLGSPWTTHVERLVSRAPAALQRATPLGRHLAEVDPGPVGMQEIGRGSPARLPNAVALRSAVGLPCTGMADEISKDIVRRGYDAVSLRYDQAYGGATK